MQIHSSWHFNFACTRPLSPRQTFSLVVAIWEVLMFFFLLVNTCLQIGWTHYLIALTGFVRIPKHVFFFFYLIFAHQVFIYPILTILCIRDMTSCLFVSFYIL